jgi:hypothetical protein
VGRWDRPGGDQRRRQRDDRWLDARRFGLHAVWPDGLRIHRCGGYVGHNITLSRDEPTGFGISSTSANVSTAGTWGEGGCEIDVKKNDDSGIEATFSCNDIPAIAISEAKAYTIDVKGEFEVAR